MLKELFSKGMFSESPMQKERLGSPCCVLQSLTASFDISIPTTDFGFKYLQIYYEPPPRPEPTSKTCLLDKSS